MGLIVRFLGGPLAGKSVSFDDSTERIVLGRDPAHCQVVFPADDTRVGREHFALIRELGRYRLQLNHDDPVFIDGKPALDGQELRAKEDNIQIGRNGPILVVETVSNEKLLPTDKQGRQHSPLTMLQDTSRRASSGKRVAGTAVLLVLAASVAGVWGYRLLNEDVRKTAKTVGELTQTTEEQRESIKGVTTQVSDFQGKIKELDKVNALEQVVRNASPSVYLVLALSPEGVEQAEATAWVVDKEKGILATNAHVGRIPDESDAGTTLLVRSNTPPIKTFKVKSIVVHPGYDNFSDLWTTYDPTTRVGFSGSESINAAGWGCDVSLLTVENPDGLADALPLAPPEVLAKLEPGYPVGLVGYPMEGIVLGGVNLKAPTPTRHLAYITAVTSYFGDANVDFKDKLLVQHALPTVGGASGSPILNADGQVVAVHSAGNSIGSIESSGVRIVSAARISYAQRSDLVRELLNGNVEVAQQTRNTDWEAAIKRYFEPRTEVESSIKVTRDNVANDDMRSWTQDFVGQDNYVVKSNSIAEKLAPPGSAPAIEFDVTDAGKCRIVEYPVKGLTTVYLRVTCTSGGTPNEVSGDVHLYNWLRAAEFDVKAGDKVSVAVSSTDDETPVVTRAYLVTRNRVPVETRVEQLMGQWKTSIADRVGANPSTELTYRGTGKMPKPSGDDASSAIRAKAIHLKDAGDYFVMAATSSDDPLNVFVYKDNDPDSKSLGSYTLKAPVAFTWFTIDAPLDITSVVVGDKEGTPVELRVYRAIGAGKAAPSAE